jgi:hypothetical protein
MKQPLNRKPAWSNRCKRRNRIERRQLRHRAAGYERRTVGFLAARRFASAILWGR